MIANTPTPALFEVVNLQKSFEGTQALKGVSLDLRPGEFHALLGENGAGKSTLIKIVTGVYPATAGEIRWNGTPVQPDSPLAAQRLGIGAVYQESSLIPGLSVAENFALGREDTASLGWVRWAAVEAEVRRHAARLGLDVDPRTRVGDLSVSQRKRVEIMKVLVSDPRMIILDEPTAALSVDETEQLMDLLRMLKEQGKAILYVTHRLQEIRGLVDRVSVLKDGSLMATLPAASASTSQIVSLMVGRDIGELYPPVTKEPGEPILRLEKGSRPGAFAEVDLTVRRGEIVGLVGLQGHGHFDVVRSLFGSPPLASGQVSVGDRKVRLGTPRQAMQAGIGFVSDDRIGESVLPGLTVRENLSIAALSNLVRWGTVLRSRERDSVDRFLRLLSIKAASRESTIDSLSGGNQQKVILSRWLAARAQVLVMLDPTAGVDVGARMEIYRILRELANGGGAVLLATSDMAEALGLCDRIYAFYRGRVAGIFPREGRREADVLAAITGQLQEGD